ncbi:MAG: hypothetical protein MJ151_01110 [Lachnospiraceae bacterium]|nr:hypothetical protein [Lachnospiraceae bacterium]
MNDIKININKNAKFIIDELHKNGFEAYIVGGCVRDALIGKLPDDYDITTNALPVDIKRIFKKTVDTGIKHGTVSVLLKTDGGNIKTYEVTTYRVDGEYIDGRHPESVRFVKNLKEDLSRRDFTVNAMAYNEEDGLIDLFDGIKDLKEKTIRAVGVAKDRYNEDALRMLRAIRFAAKLGFDIEAKTYKAIEEVAPNMAKVSKERIQEELTKILFSKKPRLIKYIYATGLAPFICDEFETLRPDDRQYVCTKKIYMAYAGILYNKPKSCEKISSELMIL